MARALLYSNSGRRYPRIYLLGVSSVTAALYNLREGFDYIPYALIA